MHLCGRSPALPLLPSPSLAHSPRAALPWSRSARACCCRRRSEGYFWLAARFWSGRKNSSRPSPSPSSRGEEGERERERWQRSKLFVLPSLHMGCGVQKMALLPNLFQKGNESGRGGRAPPRG